MPLWRLQVENCQNPSVDQADEWQQDRNDKASEERRKGQHLKQTGSCTGNLLNGLVEEIRTGKESVACSQDAKRHHTCDTDNQHYDSRAHRNNSPDTLPRIGMDD